MSLINKIKHKIYYPIVDNLIVNRLAEQHYYPSKHIQENDIIIAGFPKSGNTWMQNLVTGVLYGIDTNYLPDRLRAELVPAVRKGFYKRVLDFTCFKSHDLPKPEYRRVVHLVRDGRDAMASYYHYRNTLGFKESREDHIIKGKGVNPCKWHLHAEEWINNPYNAEIITIRYEDLLSNPLEEMRRFCDFAHVIRDDELIMKSVEGNSFKNMQRKEELFKRDSNKWPEGKKFFRKGKIGSYKEEIPPELIRFFEEESKEALTHFGYHV